MGLHPNEGLSITAEVAHRPLSPPQQSQGPDSLDSTASGWVVEPPGNVGYVGGASCLADSGYRSLSRMIGPRESSVMLDRLQARAPNNDLCLKPDQRAAIYQPRDRGSISPCAPNAPIASART